VGCVVSCAPEAHPRTGLAPSMKICLGLCSPTLLPLLLIRSQPRFWLGQPPLRLSTAAPSQCHHHSTAPVNTWKIPCRPHLAFSAGRPRALPPWPSWTARVARRTFRASTWCACMQPPAAQTGHPACPHTAHSRAPRQCCHGQVEKECEYLFKAKVGPLHACCARAARLPRGARQGRRCLSGWRAGVR